MTIDTDDRFSIDPAIYETPAVKWTQSSYVQPQMMIHDRYFYDPVNHKYTVDRYLAEPAGLATAASTPC